MYINLDSVCGCLFIEDNILKNDIVCKKPLKQILTVIVLRLLKDTYMSISKQYINMFYEKKTIRPLQRVYIQIWLNVKPDHGKNK